MQSAAIKFIVQFFRAVPFRCLYALSWLLSFCLFGLTGYRKKVIFSNLQNSFPNKSSSEIRAIAGQFYRHFADIVLETLKGLTLPKSTLQQRFRYRNPEIFKPFFEKKQSVILLASHHGNWEWGVLSLSLNDEQAVVGVYKPLKNKELDKYFNSLRKQWGLHLTDMAHTGRAVVTFKNQPTIFVLIADQTPSDIHNAHWVNFLQQDTPFLHGMDKLSRQTGYPVFYLEIERVKRGFYEVQFFELCEDPKATAEGEITRLYAERLEATIRKSPANWLWSHRRWKRVRQLGS